MIFDPPPISVLDGPILKSFGVVIAISLRFCLVYLDGLYVGNYPSKICHDFWTDFRPLRNLPSFFALEYSSTDGKNKFSRLLYSKCHKMSASAVGGKSFPSPTSIAMAEKPLNLFKNRHWLSCHLNTQCV